MEREPTTFKSELGLPKWNPKQLLHRITEVGYGNATRPRGDELDCGAIIDEEFIQTLRKLVFI